ncbi:MAG: hypothetical protein M1457_12725, partial [bacterium]|nr:hypothetical protein [bacterium]
SQPILNGATVTAGPDGKGTAGILLDGDKHPGLGNLVFSGLTLYRFDQAVCLRGGVTRCRFYDIATVAPLRIG